MRCSIAIGAALAFLAPPVAPAAAGPEDCPGHELKPDAVAERIRHWDGFSPFADWRIVELKMAPCVHDGRVLSHLQISPPARLSPHDLPYRAWLTILVDGTSGAPAGPKPEAFSDLVAGIRRLAARAERHEEVRRFIERFAVVRAQIDKTGQKGLYRLTLTADAQAGDRAPAITYDESAPDRITAYRIPHMDSLPVRRELLRMIEVLSGHHPRCRPSWIDAHRTVAAGPEAEPVPWTFRVELEGAGCPAAFSAELEADGEVARVNTNDPTLDAKGDGQ